jgi:hypothetical protein
MIPPTPTLTPTPTATPTPTLTPTPTPTPTPSGCDNHGAIAPSLSQPRERTAESTPITARSAAARMEARS